MPKLSDCLIIKVITLAFELNARFAGYVTWKPQAAENARRHFPGYTPEHIEDLALKYLSGGGVVKYAKESRSGLTDDQFHYDLLIPDSPKPIYLETILLRADIEDPGVEIKNCHT